MPIEINNNTNKLNVNSNKKLLVSSNHLFKGIILEGETPNISDRFLVKGILQRADSENQNGRIYPLKILKREAEKYAKTFISEKRAYGELDHPDSSIVEGKNSSHTVEKLWWEGKDLWGELEVLDTPSGRIVQTILRAGKTLGISSRGLGSVNQLDEDTVEVGDDFELIAWDFVTNPSTQGAFMRRLNENKSGGRLINNIRTFNLINDKLNAILHNF
jgi:hypothetical protein